MAFVAVDKDKEEGPIEWIYLTYPIRRSTYWFDTSENSIPLPKGSIEKLIGRKLTWESDPVELK